MNAWLISVVAFVAGILLGGLYFGGLWWTLRRITETGGTLWWGLLSFGIRAVLVVGGFALLVPLGWYAPAVALIGFLAARYLWIRRVAPEVRTAELPLDGFSSSTSSR